jgi:hypothetical protein
MVTIGGRGWVPTFFLGLLPDEGVAELVCQLLRDVSLEPLREADQRAGLHQVLLDLARLGVEDLGDAADRLVARDVDFIVIEGLVEDQLAGRLDLVLAEFGVIAFGGDA